MNLAEFHFIRPWWLLALLPLLVYFSLLARHRRSGHEWAAVCDAALLPFMLVDTGAIRRPWSRYALGLAAALGIVALAGPAWEHIPVPVFRDQSALVVALDLSRSMDAGDIRPSRLVRARFKIADVLSRVHSGTTALVVYAQNAYTVTPLTSDTATLTAQLPALTTDLMPAQGTRPERAVERAAALAQQAGLRSAKVLLVTDGFDDDAAARIIDIAREHHLKVSLLGVGTVEGAPVPRRDGGFLRDSKGRTVVVRQDAAPMERVAAATGGAYVALAPDDADVDQLAAHLDQQAQPQSADGDASGGSDLKADVWRDEGPWLVLLALPLFALGFRRGLLIIALLAVLPLSRPALAFEWNELWLAPDQQAARDFAKGDAAGAAQRFERRDWKGAAHYRADEFESAARELTGLQTPRDLYNLGNALARLGRYGEAVAAYDETLRLDPGDEDARYNRDLVRQQMEDPPQSGGNGQGDSEDTDSGSGKDQSREQNQDQAQQQGQSRQQPAPGAQDQPMNQGDSEAERQNAEDEQMPPQDKPGKPEQSAEQPPPEPEKETKEAPADGEGNNEDRSLAEQLGDTTPRDESQQATEQWLRRIPDDPGGLLRRKFLYQYQREARREPSSEQAW